MSILKKNNPSGRVVRNTLDSTGDLAEVESKKTGNAGWWSYANSFTYNAAGAVTSMKLGNRSWESTQYNSRLQPTQIALGTLQGQTDKLKHEFSYGGSSNNGNVMSQTITVPGLATPFVQNYTYDELNRLKTATETNNGTQTWTQVFGYDRYGNRNITSGLGVTNFSFSGNWITAHSYDSAGNTLADGSGKTFTYDAENKQKTAVVNGYTNEYFYDGDGRRVKKVVPSTGETTIFVYDAMGRTVAEYSTIVEPAATAKVAYLTADHLGSPRINTDQNGAVTARHDYHPFGEEISTSQRTAALAYSADTVRKQFTGYERDNESGLDFAEARMFGSSLGRFSSPDPYNLILEMQNASDKDERSEIFVRYVSNPQRWNMYVYVNNNPLAYTDPDGRDIQTINVFVGLADKEGMKEWEKFAKEAREKGFTVNIYTVGKGKGTADNFLRSIGAKDTMTIFAGHAARRGDDRFGISFTPTSHIGNSQAKGTSIPSHSADGIDIRNDVVAVFSCGFGEGFDNITSSTGAAFVSIAQGTEDGGTLADSVNRAGLDFAKSMTQLTRENPLLPDFNLSRATSKAQGAMTVFGYAAQNEKDKVTYKYLSRR